MPKIVMLNPIALETPKVVYRSLLEELDICGIKPLLINTLNYVKSGSTVGDVAELILSEQSIVDDDLLFGHAFGGLVAAHMFGVAGVGQAIVTSSTPFIRDRVLVEQLERVKATGLRSGKRRLFEQMEIEVGESVRTCCPGRQGENTKCNEDETTQQEIHALAALLSYDATDAISGMIDRTTADEKVVHYYGNVSKMVRPCHGYTHRRSRKILQGGMRVLLERTDAFHDEIVEFKNGKGYSCENN